ncbi:MAG: HU family DNA-binding protein [Pseudomonadota bacterium]
MKRSELINNVAEKHPTLMHQDIERVVHCVFNTITESLSEGNKVALRGFGTFTPKKRRSRTGHNPRTRTAITVDEKYVPTFKMGKRVFDEINK